jgi:hypothetical protein
MIKILVGSVTKVVEPVATMASNLTPTQVISEFELLGVVGMDAIR